MRWHNVLFRLSALISRLPSLCSEDEANTLHFLVRCWITLSQCLFAASKVDPLSRLPLVHLIIHKGHSGMKSKVGESRDEGKYLLCETKVLTEFKSDFSVLSMSEESFVVDSHKIKTGSSSIRTNVKSLVFVPYRVIHLDHTLLYLNKKKRIV